MTDIEAKRVVLITGCSRGVGRASAIAFAEHGDRVYASARNLSETDALRQAAMREDIDLSLLELDVTLPASVKRAVDQITAREGRLDIVVNNAGILRTGAFETLADADIRAVMETNFFGALNVTRAVLPTLRGQRHGHIIMMSSLSGWAGLAGDSAYAASKFALEGFSEALRHEIGRWGIRITLIEPGGIQTDLMSRSVRNVQCDIEPYAELNRKLCENLRESDATGAATDDVARQLVAISKDNSRAFRRPIGDLAKQLKTTLFRADDATRDDLLKSASRIEWWLQDDPAAGSN